MGVDELLPTNIKQCTSSFVEIKYGETFSVKATYAGGKEKIIDGEEDARAFLRENAALDDEYRDIPVPTINSEILVKAGLRAREKGKKGIWISNNEVKAMLASQEVQRANIRELPEEEYEKRIRDYINAKKDSWENIVTKIEVMFPLEENLRGIEIIDSPGVCARGGLSDMAKEHIKEANAIIFLVMGGTALGSEQFNEFVEDATISRRKETVFLVVTHMARLPKRVQDEVKQEAIDLFSSKIEKQNILFVDSMAELYAKKFSNADDVEAEYCKLDDDGSLDPIAERPWRNAHRNPEGDVREAFVEGLKNMSNFDTVRQTLDKFGRKAHYLLLLELLESIYGMYGKLWNDVISRIDMFKEKADDPAELERKVIGLKEDLEEIQNKMFRVVNEITYRYQGTDGIILKEVEEEVQEFRESVRKIDLDSREAFNQLERAAMDEMEKFVPLQKKVQEEIVAECNAKLVDLGGKGEIPFDALTPDFTEETFQEIRKSTRDSAQEVKEYTSGVCFKETHKYPVYSQHKHFKLVRDDIMKRLEGEKGIKQNVINNLNGFVDNLKARYVTELKKNAQAKKDEMDAIQKAEINAKRTQEIIEEHSSQAKRIKEKQGDVGELKERISQYV